MSKSTASSCSCFAPPIGAALPHHLCGISQLILFLGFFSLPLFLPSLAGLWFYLYRNLVFHRCIKRKFVLIQRGAGMAAAILAENLYKQV
jgi:hypothetical protein